MNHVCTFLLVRNLKSTVISLGLSLTSDTLRALFFMARETSKEGHGEPKILKMLK
jgi:hypothetical protein